MSGPAPAIAPECPPETARWLLARNDSIAAVQGEAPPEPAARPAPAPVGDLRPFARTLAELRAEDLPSRPAMVSPWLVKSSLGLISAWRGTGKSLFIEALAVALAEGKSFLGGAVARSWKVLLVDGELPQSDLLARFEALRPGDVGDRLRILSAEALALAGEPGIDLARGSDRARVGALAGAADLLVLDSLSSLCAAPENDGDEWAPIARWLVTLRHRGVAVVLIHNSGKAGDQRGSSRREDALDWAIALEPAAPRTGEALAFRATFTKHRCPLPAWDGARIGFSRATGWTWASARREPARERVRSFLAEHPDARPKAIADALGIGRTYVQNILRQLRGVTVTVTPLECDTPAPSGGVPVASVPDPANCAEPSTGAGSEALAFLRQYGVLPSLTSGGCPRIPPLLSLLERGVSAGTCVTPDGDPDPERGPGSGAVRERSSARGGSHAHAPKPGIASLSVPGTGRGAA